MRNNSVVYRLSKTEATRLSWLKASMHFKSCAILKLLLSYKSMWKANYFLVVHKQKKSPDIEHFLLMHCFK